MRFEWDPEKDATNQSKHGVSLDEASALFRNPLGWFEQIDVVHGEDENRMVAIGPIARCVLTVVFVERDEDTFRLISARRATEGERRMYHEWLKGLLP